MTAAVVVSFYQICYIRGALSDIYRHFRDPPVCAEEGRLSDLVGVVVQLDRAFCLDHAGGMANTELQVVLTSVQCACDRAAGTLRSLWRATSGQHLI